MNRIDIPITVDVSGGDVTLSVSDGRNVSLGMDTAIYAAVSEHYAGPYQVTPGPAPQVLDTAGKMADEDITIGAIPSNYGLITWNGSTLTVS